MKCVLEFGVRGGNHVQNQVIPSIKLGLELFDKLVFVFDDKKSEYGYSLEKESSSFAKGFGKDVPRISWQSSTHFVSLSIMDKVPRGLASSTLWRKENDH